MSKEKDSRWWEFYGVRYAQGTVVGAIIIFFLFSQNKILKELLFLPSDLNNFGMAHLILLAVYGLAYCYIASAPILIMHAARGLLFNNKINNNTSKDMICRIGLFFLGLVLISGVIYFIYKPEPYLTLIAFLLLLVPFVQIGMLLSIFIFSWKKIIQYNMTITSERIKPQNSEYVETYKHLREHGNSFLIVVFELWLALPIFIFATPKNSADALTCIATFLIIIFIWTFPAAFMWFFGNKLENNLLEMDERKLFKNIGR